MRQQDPIEKKIGGTTFYITPFSAFTCARITGDLSAFLGPMLTGIGPLFDGGEDGDVANLDMAGLMPMIADALGSLSGEQFEKLAKELLIDYKNVAYRNEEGDVERLTYDIANEIFCANLFDMIMLGVEVVRINFNGFFGKLTNLFGGLQGFTDRLTTGNPGTQNGAN